MKTLIPFLMVLALLGACSSTEKKSKQATIYYSAGTQALLENEYTAALQSLLKANELDPGNAGILTNLGMAYHFKGERDLAVKTLLEALKADPNNSDAKVNLASIYFLDKDYPKAEQLYKEVLRNLTYDKQARTYYNLGLIEMQARRNLSKAEEYFKLSLKEDENYCPSYHQLGMVQFARRQFNTALRNFKEGGSGSCFEAPAPHYYQGLTYMELGKFDEARMKFDEVESRFGKSEFALKARTKAVELQSIELRTPARSKTRTALESPEF